jgi:murein L,D-transpeptidase YcbB/YkuD
MSTLVISYEELKEAANAAKKTANALEDYTENLEHKLSNKISNYNGEHTQYVSEANSSVKRKLSNLRQKQNDFTTLSKNIETFQANCQIVDYNIAIALRNLNGEFNNSYGMNAKAVTNFIAGMSVMGNATALGRYLKDYNSRMNKRLVTSKENIKKWYQHNNTKKVSSSLLSVSKTIELIKSRSVTIKNKASKNDGTSIKYSTSIVPSNKNDDKSKNIADFIFSAATAIITSASMSYIGNALLKRGSKGIDVKKLQIALNKYNYNLEVDGVFGPNTERALKDYQKKHGLVADGIAGDKTKACLGLIIT